MAYTLLMRHLILMRHAKTEGRNPDGDHARRLMPRGREDSALIVNYLKDNTIAPDYVLSSDATRTRGTVECMRPALAKDCQISFHEHLYLAEPEEILQAVWAVPATFQTLLVTGHNPGMHMLAFSLTDRNRRHLRSDLAGNFPTAAAAIFSFAAGGWSDIVPGGGTLEHFVTAKSLRSGDEDEPGPAARPEWR